MFSEGRAHFCDVARSRGPILICMRRWSGGEIESEIFDGFVVAEAAGLPSCCGARFHDEECDARAVSAAGVEQRAQNFFLRGARVDAGDRFHQRA